MPSGQSQNKSGKRSPRRVKTNATISKKTAKNIAKLTLDEKRKTTKTISTHSQLRNTPANMPGNNDQNGHAESNPSASNVSVSPTELEGLISQIVKRLLQEGASNNIANSNNNENPQFIPFVTSNNLPLNHNLFAQTDVSESFDRIPDIVKSIRDFAGKRSEFNSWKRSVDRVLEIYRPFINSPKYVSILSVIRNKIIGSADLMLVANNVALDWGEISNALDLYYSDKRNIGTLEFQLSQLVQGNKSLIEFYESIHGHLSLILDKISNMELSAEGKHVLVNNYRNRGLDVFIRGLRGDLPKLLALKNPANLPEALDCCLRLENQEPRTSSLNLNNSNNRNFYGYNRNSANSQIGRQENRNYAQNYPRNSNNRNTPMGNQQPVTRNFHINMTGNNPVNDEKNEEVILFKNSVAEANVEGQNVNELSDVHFLG